MIHVQALGLKVANKGRFATALKRDPVILEQSKTVLWSESTRFASLNRFFVYQNSWRTAFGDLRTLTASTHHAQTSTTAALTARLSAFRLPSQILQFYTDQEGDLDFHTYPCFLRKLVDLTHTSSTQTELEENQLNVASAPFLKDRRFLQLVNGLTQCLNAFSSDMLVDILYLMGRLRWDDEELYSIITSLLVKDLVSLRMPTLVKCFNALVSTCLPTEAAPLRACIDVVLNVVLSRVEELTPEQLCFLATAVLRIYGKNGKKNVASLLTRIETQLDSFTPRQLSVLISAVSRRLKHFHPGLTNALLLKALTVHRDTWCHCNSQDLSLLLQGVARFPEPPFNLFEYCENAVTTLLPTCTQQELRRFLWSYQQSPLPHNTFWTIAVQELARRQCQHLSTSTLLTALIALAQYRHHHMTPSSAANQTIDAFFSAAEDALLSKHQKSKLLGSLSPGDRTTAIWAYHLACVESPTLIKTLVHQLILFLDVLRPEDFSQVLVSLGTYKHQLHPDVLPALIHEALERLTQFSLPILLEVCFGFAALEVSDPHVWKSLLMVLKHHDENDSWASLNPLYYGFLHLTFLQIKRLSSPTSQLLPQDDIDHFLRRSQHPFLDLQYESVLHRPQTPSLKKINLLQRLKRDLCNNAPFADASNKESPIILLFPVNGLLLDLYCPAQHFGVLLHLNMDDVHRPTASLRAPQQIKYNALCDLYGLRVHNFTIADVERGYPFILNRLRQQLRAQKSVSRNATQQGKLLLDEFLASNDAHRQRILHAFNAAHKFENAVDSKTTKAPDSCFQTFHDSSLASQNSNNTDETKKASAYYVMAPAEKMRTQQLQYKQMPSEKLQHEFLDTVPAPFSQT